MNQRNFYIFTFLVLLIGIIFRLSLTSNGSFIFHMDSARDFVDVREMVELKKIRMIGPTSAIDGFYNGPAWYYLLAVPYLLSGGNPYSAIIMEIILWAIGGFFLLKLVRGWGTLALITAGSLWVSSNYIVLLTTYSFNPNPVALLTPLFIYLLTQSIQTKKLKFWFLTFFLGGLFFNFEMNAGVFIPPIILVSLLLSRNINLLKAGSFWLGSLGFIICLLPQILFDLRHEFVMTNSVIKYLTQTPSESFFDPLFRARLIFDTFFNGLSATFFNTKWLVTLLMTLALIIVAKKQREILSYDTLLSVSLLFLIIPYLGYVLLPVKVNPWHLGFIVVSGIIVASFIVSRFPKLISLPLTLSILILAVTNITNFYNFDYGKRNQDPSLFANEIDAIDYTYQKAEGKDFKIHSYLPSVYDYPYQYLIWWHGKNKYGYLPDEYTYAPNKPPYVPSQELFQDIHNRGDSNLVFLIIQPQDEKLKNLWYNHFTDYKLIESSQIGPLIVETRLNPR